jgi:hypothetical protein
VGVRRGARLALGAVVLAVGLGPAAVPGFAVVGADGSDPGVIVSLPPAAGRAEASRPATGVLTVLQMNLCNSGMAGCYRGGRSVPEAADAVSAVRPDAVTVNEICRHDLNVLGAALRRSFPSDYVVWRFQPVHGRNDEISTCVNGDQYGIGILIRHPAGAPDVVAAGGEYPGQGAQRGERRVWECLSAPGGESVCATHLSAFNRARALAQCRYLMTTAIPAARAGRPAVVGGDLNLTDTGSPPVADCLPPGWLEVGDGGVQHVLATPGHTLLGTRRIALRYTDHSALVVTLRSA